MVIEINLNARGKYGSSKDKALTPDERVKMIKSLNKDSDRVIFILTAIAGLRVGELEQVRKEWIEIKHLNNVELMAINIPNECKNIHNLRMIWRPKTKRERTTYIFEKDLYLEVKHYFNHNDSIGIKIRAIQERVYKLCANILLKKKSIHCYRATAQNYMKYERGLIPEVIAVMLGHKDIRTTMAHYNTMDKAQTESYLIQQFKGGTN